MCDKDKTFSVIKDIFYGVICFFNIKNLSLHSQFRGACTLYFVFTETHPCPGGEIGRRVRFRCVWCMPCGFESHLGHNKGW